MIEDRSQWNIFSIIQLHLLLNWFFLNEYLLSLRTNVKIGKFSNLCSL